MFAIINAYLPRLNKSHLVFWLGLVATASMLAGLYGPGILTTLVPFAFGLGALRVNRRVNWEETRTLCLGIFIFCLTAGVFLFFGASPSTPSSWLRVTPLGMSLLLLNTYIALVLTGISKSYLDGESGEAHYHRNLLLTLAAITTVMVSNHLIIFLMGWIGISLGLHNLLMFYPNRPRACLAAHKKFLFARIAEGCLLGAFSLLHYHHGTWHLDIILNQIQTEPINNVHHVAACLIVGAAFIKCAQMPVHGWLMQVMEAPTTVSALLHAGIINLGGFLLILFAPLLMASDGARWLLLVTAGLSTVVSALIMSTRISIKVRLAWSTSAQMGLMLVECALGCFDLAILHLFAHSMYKAHAFINAGSAVENHILNSMVHERELNLYAWIKSIVIALFITGAWAALWGIGSSYAPWMLLCCSLLILMAHQQKHPQHVSLKKFTFLILVILVAYTLQKKFMGALVPNGPPLGNLAELWILSLFGLLTIGYLLLQAPPKNQLLRRWRNALFAGFYLDEWSTHLTLKLWPTTMPKLQHQQYNKLRGLQK
jgi:NAD(P)H-quinone oxidoreductase subunit 5